MLNNIKQSYAHIPYTLKHRKTVIALGKKYLGKDIPKRFYFHDIDKILLYILTPYLGPKHIKKIHRKIGRHHHFNPIDWSQLPDSIKLETIFDWESGRYTKLTCQLTARQYCNDFHANLYPHMQVYLDRYNL